MNKIYSYVLRFDDGAAPNPFWGRCTLTICKPVIRRCAQIGDWIIGTGSKNARLSKGNVSDLSLYIIYAMKVTDKMTIKDYDIFCRESLPEKIPKSKELASDWKIRVGDCIYDFLSSDDPPTTRESVHSNEHREHDLSGKHALLSNHFYYFGANAEELPDYLHGLIKKNQGHKKIVDHELIRTFVEWISKFEKNKLYGDPQMKWLFDTNQDGLSYCGYCGEVSDDNNEEVVA